MGEPCGLCDGTGDCPDCDEGVGHDGKPCPYCDASGDCQACDGTGVEDAN